MKPSSVTSGLAALWILVSVVSSTLLWTLPAASAYTSRAPIFIGGDADFTVANGVTGGSGSQADPYVIEGWEINASTADGIYIANNDAYFVIRGVYVHSGGAITNGIYLENASNGTVENSWMEYNWFGIYTVSSDNLSILGCNITNNSASGIAIDGSTDILVQGNSLINNSWGLRMQSDSSIQVLGNDVIGNSNAGVTADSSNELTITANNVSSNSGDGIWLSFGNNILISGNTLDSNRFWEGVFVTESWDILISGNTATGNGGAGYTFGTVSNLTLTANVATSNNFGGIHVGWVTGADIIGNTLSSSQEEGINITGSDTVNVTGNTIASNQLYGIVVDSSTGVRVHHNNLIGNTPQQALDNTGAVNAWDDGYPSGGNYWSDYGGVDSCTGPLQNICPWPDSLGDTPYVIDADSRDNYPLMSMWPESLPPATDEVLINGLPSVSYSINSPQTLTLTAVINDTAMGNSVVVASEYTVGVASFPGVPMSPSSPPLDSSVETFEATIPWPGTAGTWQYCAYGTDEAGFKNTTSVVCATLEVAADMTPPAIANLTATPDPQEFGGYVNVTATVTDPGGVSAVALNVTGPAGEYVSNGSMSPAGLGGYYDNATYEVVGNLTFTLWASDGWGNWATASTTAEMLDVAVAPSGLIVLESPVDGDRYVRGGAAIAVVGTVRTPAGDPLANITVDLEVIDSEGLAVQTTSVVSNPSGSFISTSILPEFPPGAYTLLASTAIPGIANDSVQFEIYAEEEGVPLWIWPVVIILIVVVVVAAYLAGRRKKPEEEAPAGPTILLETTDESTVCGICLGGIKAGLTVARCATCGKIFHDSCATRVANCPSCDSPIDMSEAVPMDEGDVQPPDEPPPS